MTVNLSTSLYWRLPTPSPDGEPLGYALKWALAHGGYLQDDVSTDWIRMDKADVPFLRGVAAAGSAEVREQAECLIILINQHGAVEVALR